VAVHVVDAVCTVDAAVAIVVLAVVSIVAVDVVVGGVNDSVV
jgi:hypothetical protein